MTKRALSVILVFLVITTFCHSQAPLYYCNFDNDLINDCIFTQTSGAPDLTPTVGVNPGALKPTQPLSDVTSVQSLTTPDNQPCQLPYNYVPGNWAMYFCRRNNDDSNFTCPTESGTGQCVIGKYGLVKTSTGGEFNHTYSTEVTNTGGAVQCLDFYYYVTSTLNNAKISVGWDEGADPQLPIVEVTALADNKWQQSRTTFTSVASEIYRIVFRMTRSTTFGSISYALDEIKVFDGSCGSPPVTTTPIPDTTAEPPTISTSTITDIPIPAETTTTTPIQPETTETTILIPPETTTTTTPVPTETTTTTTPIPSDTTTTTTTVTSTITTTTTATTILPETTATIIIVTDETMTSTTTTTQITSTSTTIISTTSTTTINPTPLLPLFRCDFSNSFCFADDGKIQLTNGTEFSADLSDDSEPPRVPTSDASSVSTPTNNNEKCSLPYQQLTVNSTNATGWDMWFCYQNQCRTTSGAYAMCNSGNYGLISLEPLETSTTIAQLIDQTFTTRDASGKRCLRYQYYFTVYNDQDWGQQMQVLIVPNNVIADEFVIDTLNYTSMRNNSWHFRSVPFESNSTNYTLAFRFEVTIANRTEDPALNQTIYFALDNIDLYDYNCSYVDEINNNVITETTLGTETASATGIISTPTVTSFTNDTASDDDKPDLGLILGVSLGVGIPVLGGILGGLIYFIVKKKPNAVVDSADIPMTSTSATTDKNSTVAAVVV